MRETRCMSLLPRTTLHSDSEQLEQKLTEVFIICFRLNFSRSILSSRYVYIFEVSIKSSRFFTPSMRNFNVKNLPKNEGQSIYFQS